MDIMDNHKAWPSHRFAILATSKENAELYKVMTLLPSAEMSKAQQKANNIASNDNRDSGFDVLLPKDTTFPPKTVTDVPLGIRARCLALSYDNTGKCYAQTSPFMLMSRSSMSKPAKEKRKQRALVLTNGVGLIDLNYQRELIARIYNLGDDPVTIPKGTALVQLCAPGLQPIEHIMIDSDSKYFSTLFSTDVDSTRGGLGSTGESGKTAKSS